MDLYLFYLKSVLIFLGLISLLSFVSPSLQPDDKPYKSSQACTFGGVVIKIASSQIAFIISHLSWDADLVAVEVVGLLAAFAVFADRVSIGETAHMRLHRSWKYR